MHAGVMRRLRQSRIERIAKITSFRISVFSSERQGLVEDMIDCFRELRSDIRWQLGEAGILRSKNFSRLRAAKRHSPRQHLIGRDTERINIACNRCSSAVKYLGRLVGNVQS